MTSKYWLQLRPSLLVGVGIVVSTFIAGSTAKYGLFVLAAPLLLALTVVSADVLGSRLRGEGSTPSLAALLLGGSFPLAALILALRDPNLVKAFIPVIGAMSWVVLLRPKSQRMTCKAN